MRTLFATNVFGMVDITNRVVPLMKAQGDGDIVNIASTSGTKGAKGGTVYAGSKWAVRGISQCWQAELRPHGIRVVSILPVGSADQLDGEDRPQQPEQALRRGYRRDDHGRPRDAAPRAVARACRSSPTTPGKKTRGDMDHLAALAVTCHASHADRCFVAAARVAATRDVAQTPAAGRARRRHRTSMVGQKDGFFTTKRRHQDSLPAHGDSGSWVVLVHGYSDNAQRMWFNTGIAPEIAKRHRVVAIDNRNHGQSDKPQPGGSGRAQDVVELMDHLKIQRAHIHGYSMGGGIVGQLLGDDSRSIHHRGLWRLRHERNQRHVPRRGRGDGRRVAEGDGRRRRRHGPLPLARRRGEAGRQCGGRPRRAPAPAVDLTKLTIPILAVNGSFDNPYRKTHRLWREAQTFQNVILPGKTHLTAIAAGAAPSQQYIDAIARFIDMYDVK